MGNYGNMGDGGGFDPQSSRPQEAGTTGFDKIVTLIIKTI
jgi:hypothetical protein